MTCTFVDVADMLRNSQFYTESRFSNNGWWSNCCVVFVLCRSYCLLAQLAGRLEGNDAQLRLNLAYRVHEHDPKPWLATLGP